MSDLRKIIQLISNLNVDDLSTLIIYAGSRIKDLTQNVAVEFESHDCYVMMDGVAVLVEEKIDRKETDDYDCDDYDPSAATPTKKQLDIDLLKHRLKDPRLTLKERDEIMLELAELLY